MSWWDDISDVVSDTVDAIVEEAEEFVEDVVDAAEDFGDDVADAWGDAWSDLETAIQEGNFIGSIAAFFGGLAAGIVSTIGSLSDLAIDVVGAFSGTVIGIVGAIVGGIAGVIVTTVTGDGRAGRKTARAIATIASDVGDFITESSNIAGDFTERTFDIGASIIRATTTKAGCALTRLGRLARLAGETIGVLEPETTTGIKRVNHFFVLMLENRSFDHMLGQTLVPGAEGITTGKHVNVHGQQNIVAGGDAKLELKADPPHEFSHVQQQLRLATTTPNGGFVAAFEQHMLEDYALPFIPEDPAEVMRGFSPTRLPILHSLASEFATCDHWFSSLPGPTLPNRLFVHAATSGGLADSPSGLALSWAMSLGGFEFDHGSIFDHLEAKCLDWLVYAGDDFPLVMTLKHIAVRDAANGWSNVRNFSDFEADLLNADERFAAYTFIEPNYGNFLIDFKNGNSQHPLDSSFTGEALIKFVYETLRRSPIWPTSALIIAYDEHGGFYDHVTPPAATPPGDRRHYQDWAEDPAARQFQFDRLGVRVPAVVVSPFTRKGTVFKEVCDHTTVVATLAQRFGTSRLTDRGAHARSLSNLFNGPFRTDTPVALPPVFTG